MKRELVAMTQEINSSYIIASLSGREKTRKGRSVIISRMMMTSHLVLFVDWAFL